MHKLLFVLAAIAGLALLPPRAQAEPGFYLGAGYGLFDIDERGFNDKDSIWKLYAGYSFNRVLGIELSWVDFNEAREADRSFEADGWGAAAVLTWPLSDSFSLYGKAGQFFWDSKSRRTGLPGLISDDGDDPFFGAGAKFRLSSLLDLRLEWERYDVTGINVDTTFVMLQANF